MSPAVLHWLSGHLRRIIPWAFALAAGLVAVILVRQYLLQQRQALEGERRKLQRMMANYPQPVHVVVAAEDLPAGQLLQSSQLTTADMPEKFLQPYATQAPNELVGLVTLAPMARGEQVLLNKVRRPEAVVSQETTLSGRTPKGKRAVTIALDLLTGVGGFVRAGDKVDILWTIQLPGPHQPAQPVTLTLFQDVPVLAIGQELTGRGPSRSREESGGGGQLLLTVALTPQETSFLLFAREQGRIQLSLRSKTESGSVQVAPANINTLMESQLTGKVSSDTGEPKGPATRQVEVFKGLKRDVVDVLVDDVSASAEAPPAPAPPAPH